MRPISGTFPEDWREAGRTQSQSSIAVSVFAGCYILNATIHVSSKWKGKVMAWYHTTADCVLEKDGTLSGTEIVEQWDYNDVHEDVENVPISMIVNQLMANHRVAQHQEVPFRRQPRYVVYVTDRATIPKNGAYAHFEFAHNELDAFEWCRVGRGLGDFSLMPNWYRSGFSTAFIDAAENIPQSSFNGLEAVLDLMDLAVLLKNPVKGVSQALRSIKKIRPGDVWLKYRYVFKTTQLDAEDLSTLSMRIDAIKQLCAPVKLHGVYQEEGALFRCKASFLPDAELLHRMESIPYFAGDLTAAKVWDIVPYSFIVDWFFHVSDLLDYLDSWAKAREAQYLVSDVWYSVETSTGTQLVYFRIPGDPNNPMIGGVPHYFSRKASSRTIAMRITDCLALFGE